MPVEEPSKAADELPQVPTEEPGENLILNFDFLSLFLCLFFYVYNKQTSLISHTLQSKSHFCGYVLCGAFVSQRVGCSIITC